MNGTAHQQPSAAPRLVLGRMGRLHIGRPLPIKTRQELLATIKPSMRQHLRRDTGDMPDDMPPPEKRRPVIALTAQTV